MTHAQTEVIFVGTGPAVSPPGRGNMAFAVRAAGRTLLFESGPTILNSLRAAQIDAGAVDMVLVSHRHGDHTLGFPMLVLHRMMTARDRPLHVAAGRSVCAALEELTRLVYPETEPTLAKVTWIELDEQAPADVALYDGIRLRTAPVCGPEGVPTLGMRLDCAGASVVYTGDTRACESVSQLAAGCDLLIHEANFSARLDPDVDAGSFAHSTATQAARAAREAGARILALVHLSDRYRGREAEVMDEAREVFAGEIIMPSDGDVLRLP